MNLHARLNRLEAAAHNKAGNVAFITYKAPQTKEQAIAEWEAENGPISDCICAFFTSYQPKPEGMG